MSSIEDRVMGEERYLMAFRVNIDDPADEGGPYTIAAFVEEEDAWSYARVFAGNFPDVAPYISITGIKVRAEDADDGE